MVRRTVLLFVVASVALVAAAAATGKQVYVHVGNAQSDHPWVAFRPALRMQMLFDQSRIDYAGTINEFELEKNETTATFRNVKFYLCHTPLAALTADFAANYGGNTPRLVASFATYELPSVQGVYPIPMAETFDYNNRDNLILEITWESATGGKVLVLMDKLAGHHCLAYDYQATTGTVGEWGYNARISFGFYPAVAPASFGRVKALFE
jgi:hypothetical protein